MNTSDFHYTLPPHLIATRPPENRGDSRMLVLDRARQTLTHAHFRQLSEFLEPEDFLVLNDSRVTPARYLSDDHRIEILHLPNHPLQTEKLPPMRSDVAARWVCMVRPGKKFRIGMTVEHGGGLGEVIAILPEGERVIDWNRIPDPSLGRLALPPYMHRETEQSDLERYQTVYANESGSIAAPTAGLHFTSEHLSQFPHAFLTLHVGPGTFKPVQVENFEEHQMHEENFYLDAETTQKINEAKSVVAVGTTTTRVIEHLYHRHGQCIPGPGSTRIFLYPGKPFRRVNKLLTNFHLPQSTLLMLVSAMAGHDFVMKAYHEAVAQEYRFYSYGDCMLIV